MGQFQNYINRTDSPKDSQNQNFNAQAVYCFDYNLGNPVYGTEIRTNLEITARYPSCTCLVKFMS